MIGGDPGDFHQQSSAFFAVDDNLTSFVLPQTRVDENGNYTAVFNEQMFNVPQLSVGEHHINVGLNSSTSQWLGIDYFLVTTNPIRSSSTSPGNSPGTTLTPPLNSANTKRGAIIGGAVGGTIALIALIAGLTLCYRYRLCKAKKNQGFAGSVIEPWDITGSDFNNVNPTGPTVVSDTGSGSRKKNAQRTPLMAEQRRQSQTVLHTDSGVRVTSFNGEASGTVDLPPSYTAV